MNLCKHYEWKAAKCPCCEQRYGYPFCHKKLEASDKGNACMEAGKCPKYEPGIPAREAWLYKNLEAIKSVQRGLDDAAQGKVSRVKLERKKRGVR